MRALAILSLALAFAGSAQAQDRYGPESLGNRTTGRSVTPVTGSPGARMLGWSGKVEPTLIVARPPQPLPNQPLLDGSLRNTSAATLNAPWRQMTIAPPQTPPSAQSPQPPAPAENAPWRRLTGQAQPQAPADAAPPARPTTPVQAQGPLLPAERPEPPVQPAASTGPGDQARYYSLHRQYGETPDPVAIPEKSQVFLAGGPLSPRLDEQDDDDSDTGKTAAAKKARIAADWGDSAPSPATQRVQITRP